MDKHATSRREVKQFADRMLKRLGKDGFSPPYTLMLEGMAAGFGERDWNTLCSVLSKDATKPTAPVEAHQDGVSTPRTSPETLDWALTSSGMFGPLGRASPFVGDDDVAEISLFLGGPGKGKSTLLGLSSLDFCLRGRGSPSLPPRMGVVEVGTAAGGVAERLRDMLPSSRRSEVALHSLRLDGSQAVNMFDTPLGCRRPSMLGRDMAVRFVTLAGTPRTGNGSVSGLYDLASLIVDQAYEAMDDGSRTGRPKAYVQGVSAEVDQALALLAVRHPPSNWWGCVDLLFSRGAVREAVLAQRHAVPTLHDALDAASSADAKAIFGTSSLDGEGSELLLDVFRRETNDTLSTLPCLGMPTALDMGGARITVVDVGKCANIRGDDTSKQMAIAFMVARRLVADEILTGGPNLRGLAPVFHAHHEAAWKQERGTPSRLVFDDFHRFTFAGVAADQVAQDMREGRKWGVQVAVASHFVTALHDDAGWLATHVWFLGGHEQADKEVMYRFFRLDEQARAAMRLVIGPGREGVTSLLSRRGEAPALLMHRLAPTELWRLATSTWDVELRSMLASKVGFSEAVRRLALRYPQGSASRDVRQAGQRGSAATGHGVETMLRRMADELSA